MRTTLYLAVNPNGQEVASNDSLGRHSEMFKKLIERFPEYSKRNAKNEPDHWCDGYSEGYFTVPRFTGTYLPKGTIKKLTGRDLNWDDGYLVVDIPESYISEKIMSRLIK